MRRNVLLPLVFAWALAWGVGGPHPARAEDVAGLFRLYREGRIGELAPRLEAALAAHPGDVDLRLLEGLFALRRDEPERARRAFAAVLDRAPDYEDARIGLARAHLFLGDPEAAHAVLAPVARRLVTDPDVLELFLRIDLARGRRDLAEAKLWRFREVHAGDPAMLEQAGSIARRTGLLPGAAASAGEDGWHAVAYARREWVEGDGGRAEGHLALSRSMPDGSTIALATDWRRRFSREELGVSLVRTAPLPAGTLETAFAFAPGGRTLPRASAGLSFTAAALGEKSGVFLAPGVHLSLRRYRDGTAVIGGPQLALRSGRIDAGVRADLARDAGGRTDLGISARFGWRVDGRLRLVLAAGLLRDDEGRREHEHGLSFGWSWERGDGTRLFCDVGLVHRGDTAFASGCGVALRTGG